MAIETDRVLDPGISISESQSEIAFASESDRSWEIGRGAFVRLLEGEHSSTAVKMLFRAHVRRGRENDWRLLVSPETFQLKPRNMDAQLREPRSLAIEWSSSRGQRT